jgi:release factor glutamine methyltransferase
MSSFHDRIAAARHTLVSAGFRPEDAAVDADVLARHVLAWDTASLFAHASDEASDAFTQQFDRLIRRRARREPVAFLTGHREFWGLDFKVTPATLIPRPETEFIVEEALKEMPDGRAATVLDIGTGSGCLAVAIASERPAARVIATDTSMPALQVARENARTHGVSSRIDFVRTDLASGLRLSADIIVSNPPYVPAWDASNLLPDVILYEPATALFGGTDGLSLLRRLFVEVPALLAPGGTFIVEFGYGQDDDVRIAAEGEGWTVVRMAHDLQDIPRTLVLRR